ncbi:MAG: DMT family transporter [Gammaproteobacteria bacterium]|nr:DMT family transporter [Gammaproteobacteria bacterium]
MVTAAPVSLYLRLTGVAALWGGTFIAGRIAAPELPHFTISALRFWTAFVILLPLLLLSERGLPRLRRRDLVYSALLALSGLVTYNLLFLGALELIPAGRTALVVALNPILTAVTMALIFGERLPAFRWLGIFTALTGVVIVLAKGNPTLLLQRVGRGELLMLGGAACWALYSVLGRFALDGESPVSPLALTTVTTFWGASMLSLGMPFEWSQWQASEVSVAAWAAIVYLGAGGTALGFVWYAQGLQQLGAARTAVFNNLVPVFGVLLGTLLLDETLLASMVVGGLVALAGVSLTNWSRAR